MKWILLTLFVFYSPSRAFICDSADESPIQTVRNFFWMITGFPSSEEYSCMTGGDANIESLFTKSGLVGDIDTLRSSISSQLRTKLGTSSTCSNIPSTGSISFGTGKTAYFETPVRTIPATYPGAGGSYDKRIRYVDTTTNATSTFEFNCATEKMYVFRTKSFSSGGTFRIVVVYDNTTTTKYIDVYFYDDGLINAVQKLSYAVITRIYSATSTFEMWQSRTGYKTNVVPNSFESYRFTSNANYSTQESTLHYQDLSGAGLNVTNYTGHADINSVSVTALNAPDGSGAGGGGSDSARQGCITNFGVKTRDVTSNAICPGLALSATPNTVFGDSMSLQSVHENLSTRILAL